MKITIQKDAKKLVGYSQIERSVSKTVRVLEKDGKQVISVPFVGDTNTRTVLQFVRSAVRTAKEQSVPKIRFDWQELTRGVVWADAAKRFHVETEKGAQRLFADALASHTLAAAYDFTSHKTSKVIGGVAECALTSVPEDCEAALLSGAQQGLTVNEIREVANTPANEMTPHAFVKKAQEMFANVANTKITVLNKKKLESLNAGLILAVGAGSQYEPAMIVVEYAYPKKSKDNGKDTMSKPSLLVGKGVTFDSGGIQVKPSSGASIHEMHLDMSGGAVVLGALKALAEEKAKVHVVAIVPVVENMISAGSMRPGDIIRAMNGKTVEVLNTDAEGRLILADALSYAQKHFSPQQIIDVATLTGAALVATGSVANPFTTNRPERVMEVMGRGEACGEFHWPLPLWSEYDYVLKSDRADFANIASQDPRYAGTIAAAKFLEQFVSKDIPWIHIDMAPRMDSNGRDGLGKGSTGEPLRTLVALVKG